MVVHHHKYVPKTEISTTGHKQETEETEVKRVKDIQRETQVMSCSSYTNRALFQDLLCLASSEPEQKVDERLLSRKLRYKMKGKEIEKEANVKNGNAITTRSSRSDLYSEYETKILNRVSLSHISKLWKTVSQMINTALEGKKKSVETEAFKQVEVVYEKLGAFGVMQATRYFRPCEDFLTSYDVEYFDDMELRMKQKQCERSNSSREVARKTLNRSQLSSKTQMSHEIIKFLLAEAVYCIGSVVSQKKRPLAIDFPDIGSLSADHRKLSFVVSSSLLSTSTRKETNPSFVSEPLAGRGDIKLTGAKAPCYAKTSSQRGQDLFLKPVPGSERRIPGPLNLVAIDSAYRRHQKTIEKQIQNIIQEEQMIRDVETMAEERLKQKQVQRRLGLLAMKQTHQRQVRELQVMRKSLLEKNLERGIETEEQELPANLFRGNKSFGPLKGKKLTRQISPFPMEAVKLKLTRKEVLERKQRFHEALSRQLNEKLEKRKQEKVEYFKREMYLNDCMKTALEEEAEREHSERKLKQLELQSEWKRQQQFTSIRKIINESNNGCMKGRFEKHASVQQHMNAK